MKKIVFLSGISFFNAATALADAVRVPYELDEAAYSIVSMTGDSSGRTVITKREGISGDSYAKRLLKCTDRTVLFLGSGKTMQDLDSARPDHEATPIFKGSISAGIAEVACKVSASDAPNLASEDALRSATVDKRP
ncbi:hypothetical protein D3C76_983200 [compost metagenome]